MLFTISLFPKSRRTTPVLPPQETVSSATWAWSVSGKKTNEKTRREKIFLRYIYQQHQQRKTALVYSGLHFRIIVNSIILNNFALVKTNFAKKLIFSLLLFWSRVQSR